MTMSRDEIVLRYNIAAKMFGARKRPQTEVEYNQTVRTAFSTSIISYWPFWETSGTSMTDIVNSRLATANNTLGNATSYVGKPCPLWSGTSYIFGLGPFRSAIVGATGTIHIFAKASNTSIFTDSAAHYFINLQRDANNLITISKDAANYIGYSYKAGGTTETIQMHAPRNSEWFSVGLTWSKTNERVRAYLNGVCVGESTTLGTFLTGQFGTAAFGAGNATNWAGWMSDFICLNKEATESEMKTLATARVRPKTITVLGDSISVPSGSFLVWSQKLLNLGLYGGIKSHAVGGQSIVTNMADQVTAAASDNADVIILALGANDNNAGDMNVLKSTLGTGIDDLRASNPNALIYQLNVLKLWTDGTQTVEQDKTNIRAAISEVCTSKGVTCIDTYDWNISRSDGIHPDSAGQSTMGQEVFARL